MYTSFACYCTTEHYNPHKNCCSFIFNTIYVYKNRAPEKNMKNFKAQIFIFISTVAGRPLPPQHAASQSVIQPNCERAVDVKARAHIHKKKPFVANPAVTYRRIYSSFSLFFSQINRIYVGRYTL